MSGRASPTLPKMLTPHRARIFGVLIGNGLLQSSLAVGVALLVEETFGFMIGGDPVTPWNWSPLTVVAVLAGLVLLRGLVVGRELVDAERLAQSYIRDLRMQLLDHTLAMPPRDLLRRGQGASLLRFTGDLSAIRTWISRGVARLAVAATTLAVVLIVIGIRFPMIAAGLLLLVAIGAVSTLLIGREVARTSRESRRRRTRLVSRVGQLIPAIATVQMHNRASGEANRAARLSTEVERSMISRAGAAGKLMGGAEIVALLGTVGLIAAGLTLVPRGAMQAAEVVGAMTLVGLLTAPLRNLSRVERYRRDAIVASDKVRQVLDRPTGYPSGGGLPRLKVTDGHVRLNGLSIVGVLGSTNAVFPGGKLTVIVGANGVGKSTLLQMIAGLLRPDSGVISIDDQNIRDVSATSWRATIGMVSPDLPLMRGSIRRNLLYRAPNATEDELTVAIAQAGLKDMIDGLHDGLESSLTDNGGNLSTGQRQRLQLARALLGNPKLLLLDEVEANLDPETARDVRAVIGDATMTRIVVTHRPEWLEIADQVLILEHGKLRRLLDRSEALRLLQPAPPRSNLQLLAGPSSVR